MNPISSIVVILQFVLLSTAFVSSFTMDGQGYELIVNDFKHITSRNDVKVAKDASFSCWMDALNTLEASTLADDETNMNLSPGGNFCALLNSGHGSLDALSFLLTKCEYEKFSEPLPNQCSLSATGNNGMSFSLDVQLRDCMLSLSNEIWLVVWTAFTQYKLSSYNICTKLTDELMLHRQKEAAFQLERTMAGMEGKIDEVLFKADQKIEETVASMSDRIEEMKKDVKDDMKGMINMEIKHVQHIHEEIKSVLNKADDIFEETTRKMETYVHTKLFELYENSGFNKIQDIASKLKNLSRTYRDWWSSVKVIIRSLILLLLSLVLTRTERFRKARLAMVLLALLEFGLDAAIRFFVGVFNFGHLQEQILKSFLRFVQYIVEAIIFTTTLLLSFQKNDEKKNENIYSIDHDATDKFSSTLKDVKVQIETDRNERLANEEQWKQIALMSLQKNLHPNTSLIPMTPQQYNNPFHHHNNLNPSPTMNRYPKSYVTPGSGGTLGMGKIGGKREMEQCLDFAVSQQHTRQHTQQHSNSTYQYDVIGGMTKHLPMDSNEVDDSSSSYETASEGERGHSLDSVATRLGFEPMEYEERDKKRIKSLKHKNIEEKLGGKRKSLEGQDNVLELKFQDSPLKKQKQT